MDIKNKHLEELLFYRIGDFYELFFEDGETAARELELTLTGKNAGISERIPMCGVPFHSVKPYIEKLITKAKKGGLHNRRQVMSGLSTKEVADKLMNEIAPKLSGRTSGHVRVKRTRIRTGDGAEMAVIEFVDDLTATSESKPVVKEATDAKPAKPAKPAAEKSASKEQA